MYVKIFFTIFFLGLNLYVFLNLYLKIKLNIFSTCFILFLTLSLWAANYKYNFFSNGDLLLLIVFSYSQIFVWYFLKFIFSRTYGLILGIPNIGKDEASNTHTFFFRKIITIIFSIAIPFILSINQISIIWNIDL